MLEPVSDMVVRYTRKYLVDLFHPIDCHPFEPYRSSSIPWKRYRGEGDCSLSVDIINLVQLLLIQLLRLVTTILISFVITGRCRSLVFRFAFPAPGGAGLRRRLTATKRGVATRIRTGGEVFQGSVVDDRRTVLLLRHEECIGLQSLQTDSPCSSSRQ